MHLQNDSIVRPTFAIVANASIQFNYLLTKFLPPLVVVEIGHLTLLVLKRASLSVAEIPVRDTAVLRRHPAQICPTSKLN
jgi:hypothetical protein